MQKTFILRTIDTDGSFIQIRTKNCAIAAIECAKRLSSKGMYGNVILSNTKTRETHVFNNGEWVRPRIMAKIQFKIPYDGGRSIVMNGEIVGYIDRSYDGDGWNWEGRHFGLLSDAKATAKYELMNGRN